MAPSPGRAGEVETHLGIMEVITTKLWLVFPALLAVIKIDFLAYFPCAASDFSVVKSAFFFCPCA